MGYLLRTNTNTLQKNGIQTEEYFCLDKLSQDDIKTSKDIKEKSHMLLETSKEINHQMFEGNEKLDGIIKNFEDTNKH